jgi:SAM-dependent MidA family methyltransferase
MTGAEDGVRTVVRQHGPLPFSEVVDLALYDPTTGFYATGGRAGRRGGDFLTSPEVGPLFGAVVARALDTWWREAGEPDVWTVVEAGAGPGTLARAVLAAKPDCGDALRYVLVERSAAQRELHPAGVESLADLPDPADEPVVVLANELLDNIPFDVFEMTADGWAELRVTLRGEELVGVLVPAFPEPIDRLAPDAPIGARVPVQRAACDWLRSALALAGPGGRVVVFDYASTTADLATRPIEEWVRTYRDHQRGSHPLEHLGEQDITVEVALDQLAEVQAPVSDLSQAEWLAEHGIRELVEEGRRLWTERAAIGDLAAVRGRSRLTERDALLHPEGMGAFRVVEWNGTPSTG